MTKSRILSHRYELSIMVKLNQSHAQRIIEASREVEASMVEQALAFKRLGLALRQAFSVDTQAAVEAMKRVKRANGKKD
ncbi:hypothetical protein BOO32_12430 [Vibrio navarrensis]|nr:hypothetical protein [Vibrio navarrensis]